MKPSIRQIKCIISTPVSEYISKEGDMIVFPGSEGDFAVLSLHVSMVAELTKGDIRVYQGGEIVETIPIEDKKVAYVRGDLVEIF
ncbi:MAG: hypothetical protein EB127_10650 [Alphaproteobacteria bacterium]|nr:hypothetical protein [Alphaproteobacteria bacterium]